MFSFLKRVFKSKNKVAVQDFEQSAFENWASSFSNPETRRFIEEEGDGYKTQFNKGLELQLLRKNLYAWTVNPQFQYKNLILQGTIDFSKTNLSKRLANKLSQDAQAGSAAFGFLFRYVDESNHLSFLISNQGFFRLDAYFNGNQFPLIGWTKCPPPPRSLNKNKEAETKETKKSLGKIPLTILAYETKIAAIINGRLALMLDDDTVQSEGYIAFAGQNWTSEEVSQASLLNISLESRQMQVSAFASDLIENAYIPSDARIQLALSYAAVSRMVPALIEVKKALNQGISKCADYVFAARLLMSQKLYDEAENLLHKAEEHFPNKIEIIEEKAALLYLWGRYNELDNFLALHSEITKDSSRIASLKAHLFAMRFSYTEALNHYLHASRLAPEEREHLENASQMLDALQKPAEAQEMRFSILKDSFEKNDFQSFYSLLELIKSKDAKLLSKKHTTELLALEGLSLFYIATANTEHIDSERKTNKDTAKKTLQKYYKSIQKEKNCFNKEALVRLASILKEEGETKKAIEVLEFCIENANEKKKAKQGEDSSIPTENNCNLEAYRELSELYAGIGEVEKSLETINEALRIKADDGWSLYIKAHIFFSTEQWDEAYETIFACLAVLEEELAVLDLYCKIMEKKNKLPQALGTLEAIAKQSGAGSDFRSDALHLAANYYLVLSNNKKAEQLYKKALALKPRDESLLCDYASLCIDLERINEADALMSNILGETKTPRVFQILASISAKKGDFVRSEIILKQALDETISDYWKVSLLIDLIHLYLFTNKTKQAESLLDEVISIEKSERTRSLQNEIREKNQRKIICALCEKTWFVPKTISGNARLRITCQPPDEYPAGSCLECEKTYCISCVKETLSDEGRFHCPTCKKPLKIQDAGIFWLLNEWQKTYDSKNQ
jgi:tetratricopeptide (TPR) repeat protein